MSSAAHNQQFDIRVMVVLAAPVMLFVLIYFGYALIIWRHRDGDDERRAGHARPHPGAGHLDRRHQL